MVNRKYQRFRRLRRGRCCGAAAVASGAEVAQRQRRTGTFQRRGGRARKRDWRVGGALARTPGRHPCPAAIRQGATAGSEGGRPERAAGSGSAGPGLATGLAAADLANRSGGRTEIRVSRRMESRS